MQAWLINSVFQLLMLRVRVWQHRGAWVNIRSGQVANNQTWFPVTGTLSSLGTDLRGSVNRRVIDLNLIAVCTNI